MLQVYLGGSFPLHLFMTRGFSQISPSTFVKWGPHLQIHSLTFKISKISNMGLFWWFIMGPHSFFLQQTLHLTKKQVRILLTWWDLGIFEHIGNLDSVLLIRVSLFVRYVLSFLHPQFSFSFPSTRLRLLSIYTWLPKVNLDKWLGDYLFCSLVVLLTCLHFCIFLSGINSLL